MVNGSWRAHLKHIRNCLLNFDFVWRRYEIVNISLQEKLSPFHTLIKCGSANTNATNSVPNYPYQMGMFIEYYLLTSCFSTHGNILHSLLKITLKQFMYCQNANCKLLNAFLVMYRACLPYFCDYGCLLYYSVQCQYSYGTKGQFQAVFLYCRVYFYWSSISDF